MEPHCPPGCLQNRYRILGEARTADNGKLLFQVADNGKEVVILLKPKGSDCIYCCAIHELSCFINAIQ